MTRGFEKHHPGRFNIPAEICDRLDIQPGDEIEFFTDGKNIMMKKYVAGCVLCDAVTEKYGVIEGKRVCASCIVILYKQIQ